ncbi:hypothetical protein GPECTOR_64g85 [Gonium pectorale]|uniref:glucan endo-1,3-beta-D-glucosidase n=1 Tax=Gonium pectorale TaxID=33097 RepID=A0A150G457_GONPE|nr:hypothetical protein GPECTOR_64g85 [Gonium pectorale]|eukprot:KXZ44666.1 hypothetical protein GPECTOR_64g85 [Gonium pectorale]
MIMYMSQAVMYTPLDTAFMPISPPPQVSRSNPAVEAPSAMFPSGVPAPPTNAWWTSWVQFTGGEDDVAAVNMQPYLVKVVPSGLRVASPRDMTWDGACSSFACVRSLYGNNVTLTTAEGLGWVGVEAYDDLSVTLVWRQAVGSPVAMRTTLLQGLPYITVEYVAATPVFRTHQDVWLGTAPSNLTGSKYKIPCGSSLTWLIYSSTSATLAVSSGGAPASVTATGPAAFTGKWRLAALLHRFALPYGWSRASLDASAAAAEAALDAYADVYPTGGRVHLGIQAAADSPTGKARAVLQYSFGLTTLSGAAAGELLMFSMPHHRAQLVTPDPNGAGAGALTVKGVRGNLRSLAGSTWTLSYELPEVAWSGVSGVADASYVGPIVSQLLSTDVNSNLLGAEVYKVSQALADMGRIAEIASELSPHNASLAAAAATLRQRVREHLGAWLAPASPVNMGLVYDTKWGGIVSSFPIWINGMNAAAGRNEEEKNNAYWHHLAHYGPFVYAAAVVARADAAWGAANKAAVLALVRDMANPRNGSGAAGGDPYFPFARYMDWWCGHAWATGLAAATYDGAIKDFGKWQESAPASVAAYYAIALFGSAVADPALQAWGQVLAAVEAGSARMYWQLPAGGSEAYPSGSFVAADGGIDRSYSGYGDDGKRVPGKVYQSQVRFFTELGDAQSEPAVIYGLQWAPFLPGASDLLLRTPWVTQAYSAVATAAIASSNPATWAAFRQMARACSDPVAAWAAALALTPSNSAASFDATNSLGLRHSKTSVLYWIATRAGTSQQSASSPPSPPPPSAQDGTKTANMSYSPSLPGSFFPFPTNSWWSSWTHVSPYTRKMGEEPIVMHPWRAKALPYRLEVVPPGVQWDIQPGFIVPAYDRNLSVSAVEGLAGRSVLSGNELGVTLEWRPASGSGSMSAAMLQGNPFLTVRFSGLTPVIDFHVASPFISGLGTRTGKSFKATNNGGMTYKFYFSSSVTAVVDSNSVLLQGPFTGVMRIAVLYSPLVPVMSSIPAPVVEQIYDANSDIFPTGASVQFGTQPGTGGGPDRGIVHVSFTTESMSGGNNGSLMMMSMAHHRTHLLAPALPSGNLVRIDDLRGELQHVLGSDWVLAYDLPGISWNAPNGISDASKRAAVVSALLTDVQAPNPANRWPGLNPAADPYFGSSDLAKMGQMALIAEELAAQSPADAPALQQAATKLRSTLRDRLNERLSTTPGIDSSLVYDRTWGGIVTYKDASTRTNNYFGNLVYNDHHFHYGYLLHAAAALAKGNATWLAEKKDALLAVLRDFANPRKDDPWFPFARVMDWWGGHSWALGIEALGDAKNQESTSEAVNGYYAVTLLGTVLGDPALTSWGQLLTAIEASGAQHYWQISSDRDIYPAPFNANKAVGIVWNGKVDYATWFGNNPALIHGIQYMPFTPISELLLRKEWIAESHPVAVSQPDAGVPLDGTKTVNMSYSPSLPGSFFPFPTNSWWSSWTHVSPYTRKMGEEPIVMHPWRAKALPYRLEAVPPGVQWDIQPGFIVPAYDRNLSVSAVEGLAGWSVLSGNELGVTLEWRPASGSGSMSAAMLQGNPFLTVRFSGLTPVIDFHVASPFISGLGTRTGKSFKMANNGGMVYKMYFSSPVTLIVDANSVRTQAPFTGVMRIAVPYSPLRPVMAASDAAVVEQLYDANVDIFPTGASVQFGTQPGTGGGPDRGIVHVSFTTESMSGGNNGSLMMMSMAHHRTQLLAPALPSGNLVRIDDLRGELQHVLGSDWVLAYDLPGISWNAPNGISDASKRAAVISALLTDVQAPNPANRWPGLNPAADPYFGSSDLAKMGQMALIAEELAAQSPADAPALQQAATKLRSTLRDRLNERLSTTPGIDSSLVYDRTWGGIVTYKDASTRTNNYFGNLVYNDHHFHYGYLLHAAAALAKGNATWLAEKKDALLAVLRDFANPRKDDPWFPFARVMDWWGGHSWALGIEALGDAKNQESTSEAVNGYYAVTLLGTVLGDPALTRWGQLLTAIEASGAQHYWQITSDRDIYPAPFNANKAVGIVWNGKVDYATWFGNNPALIHGIQYMPFTPISELLLRKEWIAESHPVAISQPDAGVPLCWKQITTMAQAIIDADAAWSYLTSVTNATAWYGYCAAHPKSVQLYWAASRPTTAQPITTISAKPRAADAFPTTTQPTTTQPITIISAKP